jgi:ATP-binding cassette, subfamily B, bacterial
VSVARTAWFLISLGLRVDRVRLIRAMVLMLAGYLAAPLAAVALGRFTDDALAHRPGETLWLAAVITVLLVAQVMMGHFAHLDYFELGELQEARLRTELIDLVNLPPRIEHLDSATFANTLGLVRESLFASARALEGALQLAGLVLQTAITAAILIALSPWLAFLPFAAIPPVLFVRKAQAVYEGAREQAAEDIRRNMHLVELSTSQGPVSELRIFGAAGELIRRQEAVWAVVTERMWHGQAAAAALRSVGQIIFALGYGMAIFLMVKKAAAGQATIGDLVLVITLAVQVSVQVTAALQLLSLLQAAGQTAARIESLRAMSGGPRAVPVPRRRRAPDQLRHGITLEHVSFRYPGSAEPVLDDMSLFIPAGRTLAVVGENGAGKSTLVKLLCGMYAPSRGRILIDDADLSDIDPADWNAKTATLFQDFYRFQFTLREGIGLGQVTSMHDDAALTKAIGLARAERVVAAVPGGLAGFTGHGYADGTELSGGQWQSIGLARCMMRRHPHLLVLDEPAAALDAAAEHALFERYASSAATAARERGGITVLVSHRFSTVMMADSIAVLRNGKLAEHGTHRELLARGGLYADLFQLQARAYK